MKNGLSENDIATIHAILKRYPEVRTVCIFGSRAKGNHKQGSDIDLAIMDEDVGDDVVRKIKGDLEESALPYLVDVILYSEIDHKELRDHIQRAGINFYRRS
jgi:uncharacterized protein